ncbi:MULTISPECIES: J domain-containing protein [Sphingobacterium]|uniref:J domain-containing protein n=1 Tax=Sphingobacterium TaxID=28453 RepID=UPI0028B24101|nr:J domain-containing protein [Sphingobacterium multivorum]
MKYFNECKTLDEAKKLYRKLSKQYHPDICGDVTIMQEVNNCYEEVIKKLANESDLSKEEIEQEIRFSEEYRIVIEKIILLPGIHIELIGLWIWVTGDSLPVRTQLAAAGLIFSRPKIAWYYRSKEYQGRSRGKMNLDDIRAKYGSKPIRPNHTKNSKKLLKR